MGERSKTNAVYAIYESGEGDATAGAATTGEQVGTGHKNDDESDEDEDEKDVKDAAAPLNDDDDDEEG